MSRHVTNMTIDDVGHYSPEERERIIASYPEHEREARGRGIPVLGSGRVFPIEEDSIKCDPIKIPDHYAQINGLDFGWDHPFAAVNVAYDRDADKAIICKTYRKREATPVIHAAAIKPWGDWIPCAWPHDGWQHDPGGSGKQTKEQLKDQGVKMLEEHATHKAGGYGTEAGIAEMLDRMQTDRLKVFANLEDWFAEFRLYHRKDGLIVKENDDLMSATRIAIMMLRKAETKSHGSWGKPNTGWVV